ncbi:DedA family protein [Microbacterium xanthum]|uniref:DedA family protein n=1 Tax=Microbacterium xanthum TaxID=3079794 RepID=UPI002AD4047D|nr:VTT domain-containing protein [Microbacterium sp. KSW-48]MDZ8171293.1 VTT domain-containing protein [Microbacterium sp. KSW-48]
MLDDVLVQIAGSPWALPLLFLLVAADAFLVVVPGEAAVTALGALAVSGGRPPIVGVIAVAAAAAFAGDAAIYALGRFAGVDRWRWMRTARVRAALDWANRRLERSMASIVFTARFIPFARLAVDLTAGATRVPAARFLTVAGIAATGWAAYQTFIGAAVAFLVPGGPVVAVVVSVALALALGAAVDLVLGARRRARRGDGTA